jgi:hypothetical protein
LTVLDGCDIALSIWRNTLRRREIMPKKKDAMAHMVAVHKQMTRLLNVTREADTYLGCDRNDDTSLDNRQLRNFSRTMRDLIIRLPGKIQMISEVARPTEERNPYGSAEEPAVKG